VIQWPPCSTTRNSSPQKATEDQFIKTLRLIHLYIGIFIAPAVLFFAFSGILQTFSLHENSKDGSYTPPAWILHLAQLHKKQTLELPLRKPQPASELSSGKADAPKKHTEQSQPTPRPTKNLLPMKIFFAIVGVGLIFSTFTGLYMSYKIGRNKVVIAVLFLAGIVIPVLLTTL
jgi:hypothetical protein